MSRSIRPTIVTGHIKPLEQQVPIFSDGLAWYRDTQTGEMYPVCRCNFPQNKCKWCDPVQIYERTTGKVHPDNKSKLIDGGLDSDSYKLLPPNNRN